MDSISLNADNHKNSSEDRSLLLALLASHKTELIDEQLKEQGIEMRKNLSKTDLLARLNIYLDNKPEELAKIFAALNNLEGWGQQQIYLYEYRFPGSRVLRDKWQDRQWVKHHFQMNDMAELLATQRSLALPNQLTLTSAQYCSNKPSVRFVWIQKRSNVSRAKSQDPDMPEWRKNEDSIPERIILRAYRETLVRDITSFDWDIASGLVMIMIRKLQKTDYVEVRDKMWTELQGVIPGRDEFRTLSIARAIKTLDQNDEVVRTKLRYRSTETGATITISSAGQHDISADSVVEGARAGFIDYVNGYRGDVRWKIEGAKDVVLDLYGSDSNDQRVGIKAQRNEKDVRHALQRIKSYCT